MASPFSIFRRNQRVMLAVFGVLLMIAFVLADTLSSWSGSGRTPSNPPAVRTSYGTIHEQELASMETMRDVVRGFLFQLVGLRIEAMATKGDIRTEQERQLYQNFFAQRLIAPVLTRYYERQPERAALETMLLARRAEELGIVVSENAVNEFIRFVTDNQVAAGDIQEVMRSIRLGGGSISQRRLFDALRTELVAARMRQMFETSLVPVPPGERWDYYTRLKRQVNAEVMPVPVKNFVADVADPSEDELKEFFEAHKYQESVPGSAQPGFKRGARAQLQYFKATYNSFLNEVEVSDKDIQEYYDKYKDPQFRKSELPDDPSSKTPDAGAETPPAGDAPAETPASETPAGETPGTETPPVDGAAPSESSDETPAAEKPADENPADVNPGAPQSNSDSDKKQSSMNRPAIRLVSAAKDRLLAQAESDASEKVKIDAEKDTPADDAKSEDALSDDAKSDDAPPADEAPSNETPSDEAKTDEAKSDEAKSDEANTDETPATETEEFEPLEKVREQIRRTLADRAIQEKIDRIFDALSAEMREYADQRVLDSAKDVPPFDFAAAAKRHGLDAFETGVLTRFQFTSTDLGKSAILDEIGRRRTTVAQQVFARDPQLFQPTASVDLENNRYLYWQLKHEPEQVPLFEDVRKQVLQAWKMQEARTLAREQAEKLVAEARSNKDQTLAATFGAEKIRETGKFTWLTFGSAANFDRPQVSEVPGVEIAGHDFMETVHYMDLGDIGVAFNDPQTIAYVVRVAEVDLPSSAFEDFASTDGRMYAAVSGIEQFRTLQDWMRDLEKEANVHWLREPRTSQGM